MTIYMILSTYVCRTMYLRMNKLARTHDSTNFPQEIATLPRFIFFLVDCVRNTFQEKNQIEKTIRQCQKVTLGILKLETHENIIIYKAIKINNFIYLFCNSLSNLIQGQY
jgi:hypothetical protein